MRFRLFVAFLAAVALAPLVGCGDNPTEPTKPQKVCPMLTLNPVIVHMKVGDSQVFTATGGDPVSRYSFSLGHDNEAKYGSLSFDSVGGTATFTAICRTGEVACSPNSGGLAAEYVSLIVWNICGADTHTETAQIFITDK